MKEPLVSIIIPNYNGEKYLETCLSSVLNSNYSRFEVLIVDDGSTDTSEKIINNFLYKDKRVKFEKNKTNLGAAASRNKAVKNAKGEIMVFLDNDTEVDKNWLTYMVITLTKSKKIGACQALLVDYKQRDSVQVAGVKLWAATGWGLSIGSGEKNIHQFTEIPIIALSAALAVKKEVFDMVGGFDELEAVVTEDLDLSWRIWIAGFSIMLSPKAIVYHWTKTIAMRKNMQHTAEKIYFHLAKNSLTSMVKNFEIKTLLLFLPYALLINVTRSISVFILRKDTSSLVGTGKALVWVVKNFPAIVTNRKYMLKIRKVHDKELFDKILINKSPFFVIKNNFNLSWNN